jgi:hypothetical protein
MPCGWITNIIPGGYNLDRIFKNYAEYLDRNLAMILLQAENAVGIGFLFLSILIL